MLLPITFQPIHGRQVEVNSTDCLYASYILVPYDPAFCALTDCFEHLAAPGFDNILQVSANSEERHSNNFESGPHLQAKYYVWRTAIMSVAGRRR
jgi:hypothetical protein